MLQHKADRKFCEALLSRFSIEVGRQLGDLEQNQTSIKESLQKAITGLMRDASDAVVTREPPKEAEGGAAVAAAAAPAHAPPPSVYMPPTAPIPERPQTAPSSGGFVVHSVTTDASSHSRRGMPRRPGSASEDRGSRDLPPMGKGQLPLTVFTTGDAMPAGLDQPRYAFQPRRHAGGGLTPGENRLVRVRPQSAAAQSSKGRLGGSRSAAGLLSSQTSQAAPMRA